MNTEDTTDDTTRRTDLRTVEPHYSPEEAYAALDCPYPGTTATTTQSGCRSVDNPRGSGATKARDSPIEGTGGELPVPSSTHGINIPIGSSDAAVRRRAGFSGFDENDARHDHTDEREEHRPMTDGGQIHEQSTTDLSPGDKVIDTDADDPNIGIVVERPDEPAYAREIPSLGKSVADVNTGYPSDSPVATVAYAGDLDAALDVWYEADPEALAGICEDHDVRTCDFPTARLREVSDE